MQQQPSMKILSPLVEQNIHEERYIQPEYIAPFAIDKDQVVRYFQK